MLGKGSKKMVKTLSSSQTLLLFLSGALYFCCCAVAKSCPTLCDLMDCSFPVLHHLLEFVHLLCVGDVSQPSHSLPLLLLPSIFPSIRIFSNELALHIRWPKVLEFQHQSFHEYSGLISFRIGWLDILAVQGTLKSLLQHHSSKASILWHPAFFMVLLSYIRTWLLGKL